MQTPVQAEFPAVLGSLTPLAGWLEARLSALPVDDEWRFALDLAVCEVATNIIRHALHEDATRAFSVRFDIRDSDVCIVFTDAGDAFVRWRGLRPPCETVFVKSRRCWRAAGADAHFAERRSFLGGASGG